MPVSSRSGGVGAEAFSDWVWSQLEQPLRLRNAYPGPVRVNWIHGGYVNELLTLQPRERAERVVFLGHTLHAERLDRKGHAISEGSSLLIFRVVNGSEMVIRPVRCLDLSSDCEEWQRQGECTSNPAFMKTECPHACQLCGQKKAPAAASAHSLWPHLPPHPHIALGRTCRRTCA